MSTVVSSAGWQEQGGVAASMEVMRRLSWTNCWRATKLTNDVKILFRG